MKLKAYGKKSTWLRILDKVKRVFKSKSGWLIIPILISLKGLDIREEEE